ncbi:MAG: lactonase family protein [Bacteroidia bacterium]
MRVLHLFTISFSLFFLFACTSEQKQESDTTTSMNTENQSVKVLIGTYTGQGSEGIYQFDFDPMGGMLTGKKLVATTTSPSYVVMSEDRQYVYAVNETTPGNVSAFQWNDDKTQLQAINQMSSEGEHPCHIELNGDGDLVAVSNYSSGNVSVYRLNKDQGLEPNPVVYQHEGSGPVKPNQTSAHAHCAKFDPNGKFLYVVDLGIDQVITYPVKEDGSVGEAGSRLIFDPGDGPRQLIFHPSRNIAFIINELSNSIVSVNVNHQTGELIKIAKISTLPDDFEGKSYCADIHITSNGKFLYGSNRGHNSIAIFAVAEDGQLEPLGTESVHGDWPRYFTLSPNERHLLVANQNSDNITIFEVDPQTGLLSYTGNQVRISKPVVMKF